MITCRQCKGIGTTLNSFDQIRRCGSCSGSGKVANDKYLDYDARMELIIAIKELPRNLADDAKDGFNRLETAEPVRFAKALESVRAGRTEEVVKGLMEYWYEVNGS